jgi:hypothetical protein
VYVEGRALHPVERLWLPHAWLALPSGRVVDLTWEPPGLAYLGVALESGVVRRAMLRLGRSGPVLPLVVPPPRGRVGAAGAAARPRLAARPPAVVEQEPPV